MQYGLKRMRHSEIVDSNTMYLKCSSVASIVLNFRPNSDGTWLQSKCRDYDEKTFSLKISYLLKY